MLSPKVHTTGPAVRLERTRIGFGDASSSQAEEGGQGSATAPSERLCRDVATHFVACATSFDEYCVCARLQSPTHKLKAENKISSQLPSSPDVSATITLIGDGKQKPDKLQVLSGDSSAEQLSFWSGSQKQPQEINDSSAVATLQGFNSRGPRSIDPLQLKHIHVQNVASPVRAPVACVETIHNPENR